MDSSNGNQHDRRTSEWRGRGWIGHLEKYFKTDEVYDVRKNPLQQVVTAAADGSIAALTADKYLDTLEAEMSPVHAEREAERTENWETAY